MALSPSSACAPAQRDPSWHLAEYGARIDRLRGCSSVQQPHHKGQVQLGAGFCACQNRNLQKHRQMSS